jgi:twinkle protein
MTETQYIRQAIIELKSFARKYNVHIMVIAHPAKPQVYKGSVPPCTLYSISDSAHWANKADMGFVVAIDNKQTIITVAKSRYRDQCGKPDSYQMDFAFERGRFIYAPVDEE